MALTFGAIYLLGNRSRNGFLVMMIGNLCWASIGLWVQSYGMLLANIGFFSLNIRGYLKWAPEDTSAVAADAVAKSK
jgi:hypothetical protein